MDNRNANHNLGGDDATRGGVNNPEGLGAPSSRSSESGEINILDDFSEEEDDKAACAGGQQVVAKDQSAATADAS